MKVAEGQGDEDPCRQEESVQINRRFNQEYVAVLNC